MRTLIHIILLFITINGYAQIETLKKLKAAIDVSLASKKVSVYGKTSKREITKITNGQFPDDIEASINLLKDSVGNLIAFKEIPYIESGDDYIEVTHYFGAKGRTFAITLVDQYFINDKRAIWTKTTYFDTTFKEIDAFETLTDRLHKTLESDSEYAFPYTTIFYKNAGFCLDQFNSMKVVLLADLLPKIKDYYFPDSTYNKVSFFMPDKNGNETGSTKTIYYKNTLKGYDVIEAVFFEGHTMGIGTHSIVMNNNEVKLKSSIETNILVTNKHQHYSQPITLLKIPPKNGKISWNYTWASGEKHYCTATWGSDVVEENGERKEIPVIIVKDTNNIVGGKRILYYRKWAGLVREEYVDPKGDISLMWYASTYSYEDID